MTDQTTAPGFKVDWRVLANAAMKPMHHPVPMGGYRSLQVAEAVIAEYEDQRAKAGMVVVRRELLEAAHRWSDAIEQCEVDTYHDGLFRAELESVLAATADQDTPDDTVRRWLEGEAEASLGGHPVTCPHCKGLGVADEGGTCMICDGEGWTMELRPEDVEAILDAYDADQATPESSGGERCKHGNPISFQCVECRLDCES